MYSSVNDVALLTHHPPALPSARKCFRNRIEQNWNAQGAFLISDSTSDTCRTTVHD